jgi:3'-5' exoribonuclease
MTLFLTKLCELKDGEEGDFFAQLVGKDELLTKNGKPYFRVTFRDAKREVAFPIWADSSFAGDCKDQWKRGGFYKIRALYRMTQFGPQLDLRRIRETNHEDEASGFDPADCLPRADLDGEALFARLRGLVEAEIESPDLKALCLHLLDEWRTPMLVAPAAASNHHAYCCGYLEHVDSVVRNARMIADKYLQDAQPDEPFRRELVLAGALLHDIGKLLELRLDETDRGYTPAGELIGHVLLGRDMLRDAMRVCPLDEETALRLEHVIVSHQRLAEWGSPKPPMTLEALIVHFADDLDAKYHMMHAALRDDEQPGPMTGNRNSLRQRLFRGLNGSAQSD